MKNFNFYPSIIHTDFEKALQVAIKNNKFFGNTVIHTKCLFHFAQMIKRELIKTGICKNKMNKNSLEILRIIEIICFIKKNKYKKYKELILKKLKENNKLISF